MVRGFVLYLVIPGGYTLQDEMVIPNAKVVNILLGSPDQELEQEDGGQERRQLQRSTIGAKKTVMLRVRSRDAEPVYSLDELYTYLLTDDLSARRQFERCSQGRMTLDANRYGILDVHLDVNLDGMKNTEVMNLAETYVNDVILANDPDVDSIRSWADLLIFVIPPGTGDWAAFATVSGKQSVFNPPAHCVIADVLIFAQWHVTERSRTAAATRASG